MALEPLLSVGAFDLSGLLTGCTDHLAGLVAAGRTVASKLQPAQLEHDTLLLANEALDNDAAAALANSLDKSTFHTL